MDSISLTAIQAWIAPLLAPVAPALLFGNSLYRGMIEDGTSPNLASWGSVAGTIGIEVTGALACSMAVRAYHTRDFRVMWVSIASALTYAVFVYAGIQVNPNSKAFASSVVISLVAYLMLGVYQSYKEIRRIRIDERQEAAEETGQQVDLMTAETMLTKARAQLAKAGGLSSVDVHGGRPYTSDPDQVAAIRDYWSTHPEASLREVGQACGCSPMTARKYKGQSDD